MEEEEKLVSFKDITNRFDKLEEVWFNDRKDLWKYLEGITDEYKKLRTRIEELEKYIARKIAEDAERV
jgi:hypothetical protein